MTEEQELSKESQRFIENLRLYLFSSGKQMDEINDIVAELETHLLVAEENGKSVDEIIGQSPKEYMDLIANEMAIDYSEWIKYLLIVIIGSFSFIILQDLLAGNLAYSVLTIVGFVFIGMIFLITILIVFKYISSRQISSSKEILLLAVPAGLPMFLFLGLYLLNDMINTPVIYLSFWGSIVVGIIAVLCLIGISIWAKLWTPIIVVLLLVLPDYLLGMTTLTINVQLMLGMVISFGGIGIYFWFIAKKSKTST